jgi:hypothetical protein
MGTIILNKGDLVYNEINKIVCESGEYQYDELVPISETNNPKYSKDFPLYQYQAHYVKYGTNYNQEFLEQT